MQLQSTYSSSCFRTWRLRLFAQAETNSRFYDFQSNCFPGDVCVCQLLSVRRFSFCSSESKQESRTEAATSTGASGGRFVSSPSCAPPLKKKRCLIGELSLHVLTCRIKSLRPNPLLIAGHDPAIFIICSNYYSLSFTELSIAVINQPAFSSRPSGGCRSTAIYIYCTLDYTVTADVIT